MVSKMKKTNTFVVAVLYGGSWFVGPLNLVAAILALHEGRNPTEYLPTILLSFAIIVLVHRLLRWFPFRRRVS